MRVRLFFMYMPYIKFQDSNIRVLEFLSFQKVLRTDRRKDGRTDRPKPMCPLNFFEVGDIKSILNVSLNRGCATSPAAQQHRTRQYIKQCIMLNQPK